MVQISGGRIRRLREELELTQLYLATSVGVTTETISRWERTQAPTIKKENWLRLAKALEVAPGEILAPGPEDVHGANGPAADLPALDQPVKAEAAAVSPGLGFWQRVWPWAGLGALIMLVLLFWLVRSYLLGLAPLQVEAWRIMPAHTGAGQIFPVVIRVAADQNSSSSLLVREELPPGCVLVASQPRALEAGTGQLKWLGREGEVMRVVYLARCEPGAGDQALASFSGSVLLRRDGSHERTIQGLARIEIAPYHWADQDRNHQISDEEVLAVYDDFGGAEVLGLDVEWIEEMWLGSGYRWLPEQQTFEILP